MELYRESLLDKPAILVINKMDLPDAPKTFKEIEVRLNNMEGEISVLSKTTLDSLLWEKKEGQSPK